MLIKHKHVIIDDKSFMIKYLVEVEDYELEISNGKIGLWVLYFPERPMSLNDTSNVLENYSAQIQPFISAILENEEFEFYNNFEMEERNSIGSTGGRDIYSKPIAEYAYIQYTLKKT